MTRLGRGAGHHEKSLAVERPLSESTAWRRARGRPTLRDKAVEQQYLTPGEEGTLLHYVLEHAERGYPLPVKALRALALIVAPARGSDEAERLQLPGKNWPQGFYKRHPSLKAKTVEALDRVRHDDEIHDKTVKWFALMERQLSSDNILPGNVYNMDETGMLLSHLTSQKVMVSAHDPRRYRVAPVNRTLITAIEGVTANSAYLPLLIIWPSTTTRSNWYTYPTLGWRFACSKTGYTDTDISLDWIRYIFEPLTRE